MADTEKTVQTIKMLAGGCVLLVGVATVLAFPPAAAATAATGTSVALTMAGGLGGNVLATWIDRFGCPVAGKAKDFMLHRLSGGGLPINHDVERAVLTALKAAIDHCVNRFAGDVVGGPDAQAFVALVRRNAKALAPDTLAGVTVTEAEMRAAVTDALGQDLPPGPLTAGLATAVHALLVGPLMDGKPAWRSLSRQLADLLAGADPRLPGGLADVLTQLVREALKADDRFFRIILLGQAHATAQAATATQAAVSELATRVAALHQDLVDGLPAAPGGLAAVAAALRQDLADQVTRLRAEFDHDRAPHPDWTAPGPAAAGSLVYWDRQTALVGRDAALAALNRFLTGPEPLSWTVITGPAGMGKSRLALEALLPWRDQAALGLAEVGFLTGQAPWITERRYDLWRAPLPALLVIDYAGVTAEAVRNLVDNLASRPPERGLLSPVRLILLDTLPYDSEFGAHHAIANGTESGRRAAAQEWRGDRASLDLDRLDDAGVIAVASHYAGQPLDDAARARVTAALRQDPELSRPLFAGLLGLSLRAGTTGPLDHHGVTRDFLERQERDWRDKVGATAADLTLLAIATVAERCPLDLLDNLAPELRAAGVDTDTACRRWSQMTGKVAADTLGKLEPDFVGGLFVLRHLSGGRASASTKATKAQRVMDLAWRHGDPTPFLANLAANFGGVANFHPLLTQLFRHTPPDTIGPDRWAMAQTDVVFALTRHGADGVVDAVLDALAHVEDGRLGPSAHAAALFAAGLTGEFTNHPRTNDRLAALRDLANRWPEDQWVRLPLAMGLFNAFNNAGTDTQRANALLQELRTLASDWPQDTAVREQLAKGLFNAFNDADSDTQRANALLQELRTLASDWPQDTAVRERLAKGLF
ncbi:hypothetical protein, partial [Azospirillum sp. B4]|uniref:hypothetical protein n=1 Tax=Azospirillum sp. B4 TaxID=95605 RepID=UPI0005C7F89D